MTVPIPEEWQYKGFRYDIADHCQYCNKETNRLHWFQMNKSQVATICDTCFEDSNWEERNMTKNKTKKEAVASEAEEIITKGDLKYDSKGNLLSNKKEIEKPVVEKKKAPKKPKKDRPKLLVTALDFVDILGEGYGYGMRGTVTEVRYKKKKVADCRDQQKPFLTVRFKGETHVVNTTAEAQKVAKELNTVVHGGKTE